MPTVEEQIEALEARLDLVEPKVDANTEDISLRTISRAQISKLSDYLESRVVAAGDNIEIIKANLSKNKKDIVDLGVAHRTMTDKIAVNEAVTGAIDGSNRIFITNSPYVPGTLVVAVDDRVYYATVSLTESDPSFDSNGTDRGSFTLAFAPTAGKIVKALFYIKG